MTGTSSNRALLGVIVLGAFVLRVFPFFGPDGAWTYRVDYDEGVYFSAASKLLDGIFPYRDFVFVHPPGLLVFLSLTSWTRSVLGVDGAFALSRWIAAILGAVNVLLVARLVQPSPRPSPEGRGGLVLIAAALYATYPEIVQVERGPFLEPLLNFVCLSLVLVISIAAERRARWVWLAGALAGFAISIKLWALVWIVGAVWALSSFATKRELAQFLAAAALTFAIVVLPFALLAPGNFVTQVGLFHAWRPPDGFTDRLPRLEQLFALRHLASPVLATLMVIVVIVRRELTVISRVAIAAWVLTLAAFLSSPSYWTQYNAHLIASEAVLAGLFVSWLWHRKPTAARAVLALTAAALVVSIVQTVWRSAGDASHLQLARSPLKSTPECVFSFEPGWTLAAGRLPPSVVDSYAHQLLDAVSGGRRFPDAAHAFAANQVPLPVLEQCQNVLLGDRGRRQLSPEQLTRLNLTHAPVMISGLEVWQRRPASP